MNKKDIKENIKLYAGSEYYPLVDEIQLYLKNGSDEFKPPEFRPSADAITKIIDNIRNKKYFGKNIGDSRNDYHLICDITETAKNMMERYF